MDRFRENIPESLFAYLETTYATLVEMFGQPETEGGWEKTRAEWVVESPMGRIIIGDWNDHRAPLKRLTRWCVNGESDDSNKDIFSPVDWLIRDRPAALAWLCSQLPGAVGTMLDVGRDLLDRLPTRRAPRSRLNRLQ